MNIKVWNGFLRNLFGPPPRRRRLRSRRSALENLEARLVLFAASGNAWPSAQVVTISFVPDGTNLGGVTSNLQQAFNSSTFLVNKWQGEILRAAQAWAQQTNLNFTLVGDSGFAIGAGNYQQGDPTVGDIRIGGYNFGNSTLARAYDPPPVNNFSIAGDVVFNTGVAFRVGSGYDLFTVAAHEIGHALGLDHTSAGASSVMWSSYNGVKSALSADDIAGIRNIYSGNLARSADAYEGLLGNNSFLTASDLSSAFSETQLSTVVTGLNVSSTSDVDFYKFTAPTGASANAQISVQSAGLSLLAPKVTIYAADLTTILGTVVSSVNGATLNLQLPNLLPGQTYFIKVQGATTNSFGTGQYALVVNLGTDPNPVVPLPNTMLANGEVPSYGGGEALEAKGAVDSALPNADVGATPAATGDASRTSMSSGSVFNGGIADRTGPTVDIHGSAPSGSTITIRDARRVLGTAKAGPDGSFDLRFVPLGTSFVQSVLNLAPSV